MSSSAYVRAKIATATRRSSRLLLPEIAARRLRAIQQSRAAASTDKPDFLDYFEQIAPTYERPQWLAPYAARLQCAIGGDLRVAFAAPPQHSKTESTLRAFLYWARFYPALKHAYVTFSITRTREVAKEFQRLAQEAGFEVTGTLDEVHLSGGTRIKFTSVEGNLTGYAITGVCVIDDPISGPIDARSAVHRQNCIAFWSSVARARRHPGTSYIVMATRWHPDDLSGHLIKNEGFEYINLKAIATPQDSDDIDDAGRIISDPLHRFPGESLWQSRKPPEFFREEKADRFWWAAMYQGEPRPAGGTVFRQPGDVDDQGNPAGAQYYRELPASGYRGAFGLDLAYSSKTSSDFSICIEGWAANGKLYIVDVQRKQVDAPSFALTLKHKTALRKGWPMRWYTGGGGEKGSADFLKRQGIPIKVLPAKGDKFVRAQSAAAAWNRGDVLLPDPELIPTPWLHDFVDVVCNFTGVNDVHDDDVDALAALFDQLFKTNPMLEALAQRNQK